jgi:tetraacyldisaccharide 4'-kinase
MLGPDEREKIWQAVRRHAPEAACFEATHAPRALLRADGTEQPLDALHGQPVAAFCGIGNPAGFRHTLDACACQVADLREYSDHHRYTPADVESLAHWAKRLNAAAVLCTHKDLVKLAVDQLGECPLWAVGVGLEILSGEDALESRLELLLSQASSLSRRGESE